MSSPVKSERKFVSLNVSKQADNPPGSFSESSVSINVSSLPDDQCIPYRQETWTAAVKEYKKNPMNVVYVEGTPPPQYYNPGQSYAPTGGYSAPPPGYRQGYYLGQQPVYYAPPPPPPNVGRGRESHRSGQTPRETVDYQDPFSESFDDKYIRARFIRKVYTLLMCQLLVTSAVIAFFLLHKPTKRWVQRNIWVFYLSLAVFFVTYLAIVCCSSVRRQFPCNFVALSILTLAESYMTGVMSSTYDTYIVLMAFGTTAIVCLAISIFACQTKCDITGWGMYLAAAGLVLLLFGIITILVTMFTDFKLLNLIYAGLMALLFSVYLMYDTQQIMGGKKIEISPEEHIYAVVQLYMDIILIFSAFLTLCGWSD